MREKTAALNMEGVGEGGERKLWKITKQLNGEDSRGRKITPEEDGPSLTGKQTADHSSPQPLSLLCPTNSKQVPSRMK